MRFERLPVVDALLISPRVHGDDRGFFYESWRQDQYSALGIGPDFVQDNHSRSTRGVLRGLHYQLDMPQGKLVRTIVGEIYDVIVDLRRSSSTFRQWVGVVLSADNHTMLWVPPGFAHGFQVVSDVAEIAYKCTTYYAPEDEHTLLWNDSELAIDWRLGVAPNLSAKDQQGKLLLDAPTYP
ncbi:MAG: dTDP-4-dehydrorhamnose 3,5-epimerase [Gammaproteobacteria bacterium]|nr:MAG: dTDP-4-dehydrorhamnose 3,5-epimerase [Gammaproteobacteria bacterium]RLA12693.1 MAG: dTDP-4-dehydrorhamnose 3,5-epimerase [Gammaproteobacteria bacterium]RLA17645.1 MAG: dTDP-4-dehydrorhamnose 3,5-epimerase [Gammaproteobacteria bacterium]